MKENELKQNTLIPFTVIGAFILGVYFGMLEPLLNEWSSLDLQKNGIMEKLVDLRKNYSEDAGTEVKKSSTKNTTYLLNYLDALVLKSDIAKLKSYQPIGVQGVKGVPSYQIRFAANAASLHKFMYLSEETTPRLAISSCRASSLAGGSVGGMRQLECLLTVSLVTKGNESKVNIAGLSKFKPIYRDPFSEVLKPEPKPVQVFEPVEIPEMPKWTLSAVMSEGETDILVFKKEGGGKYSLTLKRNGAVSLSWVNEQIELKVGEQKVLWSIGETKTEDTLYKELIENIKNGDTGKGSTEKAPEASGAGNTPEENINKVPGFEDLQVPTGTGGSRPFGSRGRRRE